MSQAYFHVNGDLYTFLNHNRRQRIFDYSFNGTPSVKHLIEALRIPHTEIGRIVANDLPVGLDYKVQNDDRIEIFPVEVQDELFPGSGTDKITPQFVLDNHLGKLAIYLRILGFDVRYNNDFQDEELAKIAHLERRILLTRDRGLLMRSTITDGYCIRNLDPKLQLIEVIRRYGLITHIKPFQRCLRCNSLLKPINKCDVIDRLEPLTQKYYDDFCTCTSCDQIYWKGSHYKKMNEFVNQISEDLFKQSN